MITVNFLQFFFNYVLAAIIVAFAAMKLSGTPFGTAFAFIK